MKNGGVKIKIVEEKSEKIKSLGQKSFYKSASGGESRSYDPDLVSKNDEGTHQYGGQARMR